MPNTPVAYRGTGKRKTSVARVVLVPGSGQFVINGKALVEYFPRPTLQSVATAPLRMSGTDSSFDVRARIVGGGISGQAGALRHGIARALLEADENLRPDLKKRRLPDARRPPGRAQEGRPQEGAQAAAVLEALDALTAARKLFGTDGVRGRAGVDLTEQLAGELGAAAARWAGPDARILIGRDTRESGPLLEAALVEGIAAAGGVAVSAGRGADAWRGRARAPTLTLTWAA